MLGAKLRELREAAGLSVADVAARIGRSESVVRRYEGAAGGIDPSASTLSAYLEAVGADEAAVAAVVRAAGEPADRVGLSADGV